MQEVLMYNYYKIKSYKKLFLVNHQVEKIIVNKLYSLIEKSLIMDKIVLLKTNQICFST